MKRLVGVLYVLFILFAIHPHAQAVSAGCCVYQLNAKTAGCLDTIIPNYLEQKVKDNPASMTDAFCNQTSPGMTAYSKIFSATTCSALTTTYQCGNPPAADGNIASFKQTVWPTMSFCAYQPAGSLPSATSNPYVACIPPISGSCPVVSGYRTADVLKSPLNNTTCPTTNPVAFTTAQQQGGVYANGKMPVVAGTKTCVYYKGTYKQDHVLTCKPTSTQGNATYCDAPTDPTVSVQPRQQDAGTLKECTLAGQCCVLVREDFSGKITGVTQYEQLKKESKYVTLQCHPVNLGCDYLFYQSGSNEKQGDLGKIETVIQPTVCSSVPQCASKTLAPEAAMDKYEKNRVTLANVQADSLSAEEKKQLEEASDKAGKAVWTKALCEKETKNIWAPPKGHENETVGPFCYVNPEKANVRLNVGIGGVSVANLGKYIPAIFNYSLFLLAFLALIMIIVAGVQYAMAGGNPGIIGSAKSLIFSSLIALAVGLGGYGILQTISPALVELKAPPIPAVIPTQIYMPGDSKICCDESLRCYEISTDQEETYILVKGEKIKVGKNAWEEIVGKGKCYDVQARGEVCRIKGPIADACTRAGGTCVSDSSQAPSQQGSCSVFWNNYIKGIGSGLLSAGNKLTLGIGGYLVGKISNANATPDDLTPGEGPLGKCVKLNDKRKSGEVCYANSMCESGKCVRLKQTAGCWNDREYGFCSDGNENDICDPQGHTIVGGVNTFEVRSICKTGLTCQYVADKSQPIASYLTKLPPQIEGPYYECSNGSLGAACGSYTVNCTPDAVREAMEKLRNDSGACGNVLTLKAFAQCMYENNRDVFFEYFDKAHTALNVADTASWVLTLKATDISKNATLVMGAISIGLDVAKGVADKEFQRYLANIERYAYAAAHMDPDMQECRIDGLGEKNTSICNAGVGLQCVKTESGALRCLQDPDKVDEGSICNGQKNTQNKDTCEEAKGDGWKCSVNRTPQYANSKEFYGYCTKGENGSKCNWTGTAHEVKLSDGSYGVFNYEPRDCDKVAPYGPGASVCIKEGGPSQPWGTCAWMSWTKGDELSITSADGKGSVPLHKYLPTEAEVNYTDQGGTHHSVKMSIQNAGFKQTCAKNPSLKDSEEVSQDCLGVYKDPAFQSWALDLLSKLFTNPATAYVETDYGASMQAEGDDPSTQFLPICYSSTPDAPTGQCGAMFQYRSQKGSTSYTHLKLKPF